VSDEPTKRAEVTEVSDKPATAADVTASGAEQNGCSATVNGAAGDHNAATVVNGCSDGMEVTEDTGIKVQQNVSFAVYSRCTPYWCDTVSLLSLT